MRRLVLLLTFLVFTIHFFSCSPTNPWENDDDSDDVSSVSAVNNTQVEVIFSTGVEESSAEAAGNYSINAGGTTLAVNSAVRDTSDNKIVRLSTASQENVEYTLIVTNVTTIASGSIKSKTIDTTNNPDKFTGDELPYLISATRKPNNVVTLTFSEAINASSAVYSIEGNDSSILNIISVTNTSGIEINIVTDSQTDDIIYTVTVNNVSELNDSNDGIDTTRNSATFTGYACLVVANLQQLPNYVLQVTFSKPLNTASANTKGNYSIFEAGSPSNILDFSINYVSSNVVELVTNSQIQNMPYGIEIQGIIDALGNEMIAYSGTFSGDAKPTLVNVVALPVLSVLKIDFSESMLHNATANAANNYNNYSLYEIDSIGGSIISDLTSYITFAMTVYFDHDYDIVVVDISDYLPTGNYRLIVNTSVEDLSGNQMNASSNSFDFFVP